MRHVDDGTIHAWLDHQVTDSLEVAWLEEHLRECGVCAARLAEEGATLERADALLGAIAPSADAGRPAFDALVAKTRDAAARSDVPDSGHRHRAWLVPASWAASVMLALALGWAVRDLVPGATTSNEGRPPATSSSVETLKATAPQESTTTAAAPSQTPAGVTPERQVDRRATGATRSQRSQPRGVEGTVAAAGPAPVIAGGTPAAAEPPLPAPSPAAPPPPPAAAALPPASAPSPLVPAPVPAPTSVFDTDAARVAAQPAAARGGGGRGGGRGGAVGGTPAGQAGGAGVGFGSGQGVRPAPNQSLVVDAMLINRDNALQRSADGSLWQPIQRSDAAARTGMPLYGIDGLTPGLTTISPDGASVRTVYRLASGEVLEIVQRRREEVVERANVVAEAPVVDVQNARVQQSAETLAQQPSNGANQGRIGLASPAPPVPPVWSTVRGDVLLTLRGTADPGALASKLRRD